MRSTRIHFVRRQQEQQKQRGVVLAAPHRQRQAGPLTAALTTASISSQQQQQHQQLKSLYLQNQDAFFSQIYQERVLMQKERDEMKARIAELEKALEAHESFRQTIISAVDRSAATTGDDTCCVRGAGGQKSRLFPPNAVATSSSVVAQVVVSPTNGTNNVSDYIVPNNEKGGSWKCGKCIEKTGASSVFWKRSACRRHICGSHPEVPMKKDLRRKTVDYNPKNRNARQFFTRTEEGWWKCDVCASVGRKAVVKAGKNLAIHIKMLHSKRR